MRLSTIANLTSLLCASHVSADGLAWTKCTKTCGHDCTKTITPIATITRSGEVATCISKGSGNQITTVTYFESSVTSCKGRTSTAFREIHETTSLEFCSTLFHPIAPPAYTNSPGVSKSTLSSIISSSPPPGETAILSVVGTTVLDKLPAEYNVIPATDPDDVATTYIVADGTDFSFFLPSTTSTTNWLHSPKTTVTIPVTTQYVLPVFHVALNRWASLTAASTPEPPMSVSFSETSSYISSISSASKADPTDSNMPVISSKPHMSIKGVPSPKPIVLSVSSLSTMPSVLSSKSYPSVASLSQLSSSKLSASYVSSISSLSSGAISSLTILKPTTKTSPTSISLEHGSRSSSKIFSPTTKAKHSSASRWLDTKRSSATSSLAMKSKPMSTSQPSILPYQSQPALLSMSTIRATSHSSKASFSSWKTVTIDKTTMVPLSIPTTSTLMLATIVPITLPEVITTTVFTTIREGMNGSILGTLDGTINPEITVTLQTTLATTVHDRTTLTVPTTATARETQISHMVATVTQSCSKCSGGRTVYITRMTTQVSTALPSTANIPGPSIYVTHTVVLTKSMTDADKLSKTRILTTTSRHVYTVPADSLTHTARSGPRPWQTDRSAEADQKSGLHYIGSYSQDISDSKPRTIPPYPSTSTIYATSCKTVSVCRQSRPTCKTPFTTAVETHLISYTTTVCSMPFAISRTSWTEPFSEPAAAATLRTSPHKSGMCTHSKSQVISSEREASTRISTPTTGPGMSYYLPRPSSGTCAHATSSKDSTKQCCCKTGACPACSKSTTTTKGMKISTTQVTASMHASGNETVLSTSQTSPPSMGSAPGAESIGHGSSRNGSVAFPSSGPHPLSDSPVNPTWPTRVLLDNTSPPTVMSTIQTTIPNLPSYTGSVERNSVSTFEAVILVAAVALVLL